MTDFYFDQDSELKISSQNPFVYPKEENVFLGMDFPKRGLSWHISECSGLIALCEIFNIQIAGLAVEGTVPTVFIVRRPSVPGGCWKKYFAIHEFTYLSIGMAGRKYFKSDVDLSYWNVPCHFDGTDWRIDI